MCQAVAGVLELCDTVTATLNGGNSTPSTGLTYSWTTNNGNIVSGASTSTPIVNADGDYILTVTDGAGCSSSDTLGVIIDPLSMNLLGILPYGQGLNDIWGYTSPAGVDYALVGLQTGVSIVSLLDPTNPTEVNYISGVSTTWRDLKTFGSYAYVINEASSGGGLLIIDLSNLTTNPATSVVNTFTTDLGVTYTDSHNIYIDEFGKAYLFGATCTNTIPGATTNRGTLIADVAANPTNPVYIGAYPRYDVVGSRDTYVHDGYARGDTLYTGHIYDGTFGVIDVSNIGSLPNGLITANEVLALQTTPGLFTHAVWVSDDGNTLVAVDEKGGNTSLGVNTYDISNLSNIQHLDNIESFPGTNVIPHNVFIKGNYIVVSYYTSGVVIIDFSDPTNLVIVEGYDTSLSSGSGFTGCWGVYPFFDSGLIIATDRQEGLHVFEANCTPASRIEGKVTDIDTGLPIAGATVDILSYDGEKDAADILGCYSTGIAYCGTFDVVFNAPCYEPDTISVTFTNDVILTINSQLDYICCDLTSVDVGDLVEPVGFVALIQICEGDDMSAFTTSYSAADETNPGNVDEYYYILTDNDGSTYPIITYNTSGDFNYSTLASGDYMIWGFSFNPINATTANVYLSSLINNNILEIQTDITNSNICADVDNEYASQKPARVIINALPVVSILPAGSATVCPGDGITLTASSTATTYLWSDGSTNQTLFVNSPGSYSVTVTDANGCSNTSSTFILNNFSLPATPTITPNGPTTFCQGGSVVLMSSSTTGNVWSNGATTQNITVNTSGSYSVDFTDANGCSASSSQVTVTVLPNPTTPTISASGPTTFCNGGSVTLTSSSIAGNLWSNGATTQSIVVSATGVYSVDYTDINGCTASSASVSVTVLPVPATPTISISGPTTFCSGGSVTLTSNSLGGNLWSNGATSQSIVVTTGGTYNVTVTSANGCSSTVSQDVVVTVNNVPDASFNNLNATYCAQDPAVSLIPVVSGGSFSGPGVSGNIFDPSQVPAANLGNPIIISYTITVNGCTETLIQSVTVDDCITPGLQLTLKAYLEGALIGGGATMRTGLNQSNLIPMGQPYNQFPWFYTGTETIVGGYPANMVDWVYVEMRTGTPALTGTAGTVVVDAAAGILLSDGTIVSEDGVTPLTFDNLSLGTPYHVLLRHRNHLDVLSRSTIAGSTNMNFDFTTSLTSAFGNQQLKQIQPGKYALYAGDYDPNGIIQISDFNTWGLTPSVLYIYDYGDGNMDGIIQTTDYDVWFINQSKLGPIEVQY